MRLLAEGSGAQVYCVDYKLAPEYQWPVQIQEGEFVVRWLCEHAAERGVDPDRIARGGDSAGGNMTCTISLKLRDELTRAIAAQPDRPRRQNRSYRLTNVTKGVGGEMTGDMEYSDGRVRRFRVARGEDGELVDDVEELDRVAVVGPLEDGEPPPEATSGNFNDVFGLVEGL